MKIDDIKAEKQDTQQEAEADISRTVVYVDRTEVEADYESLHN